MSNVIQLLERLGEDASLQTESALSVIENANLDAELKESLINKDVTSLERQLDVCPDIVCLILPAEDDDQGEDDDNDDDNDDDSDTENKLVVNS